MRKERIWMLRRGCGMVVLERRQRNMFRGKRTNTSKSRELQKHKEQKTTTYI
jgi:hypothetical protein